MNNVNIDLKQLQNNLTQQIQNLIDGTKDKITVQVPPIPIVVEMVNRILESFGYMADYDYSPHTTPPLSLCFYTVYKNKETQKTLTLQCGDYIQIGCKNILDTTFEECYNSEYKEQTYV